jgi:hypothetical protein
VNLTEGVEVKRIVIAAGLLAAISIPAVASASTPTGRHFGVYRYVYRHAVKRFGMKVVGCELMYTCHTDLSDEVVVASTHRLETMLHPPNTFHATAHDPEPVVSLPYGNWAIPSYIVQCESTFQNLPPNGAGASGYYQIIPSTWLAYGGGRYASQAYEASKSEQDVIAARIWNGGAGAHQWVCA